MQTNMKIVAILLFRLEPSTLYRYQFMLSTNLFFSVIATLCVSLFVTGKAFAVSSQGPYELGFHISSQTLSPARLATIQSSIQAFLATSSLPDSTETESEVELNENQNPETPNATQNDMLVFLQTETITEPVIEVVSEPEPELLQEPTAQEPTAQAPTATLSTSSTWVERGASTTLSWNSEAVSQCHASGNWSGSKAVAGAISSGPITQDVNFTLNCHGEQGAAVAMTTVRVRSASLSWSRPSQNADGSPLIDLAAYRIYFGSSPGDYTETLNLSASTTQVTLDLAPGQYYFSITGIDSDKHESQPSAEVSKLIQ